MNAETRDLLRLYLAIALWLLALAWHACGTELVLRVEAAGARVRLTFDSAPGCFYQIDRSPDLRAWTVLGPPQPGTGDEVEWFDTPAGPHGFYRVRQL